MTIFDCFSKSASQVIVTDSIQRLTEVLIRTTDVQLLVVLQYARKTKREKRNEWFVVHFIFDIMWNICIFAIQLEKNHYNNFCSVDIDIFHSLKKKKIVNVFDCLHDITISTD